MWVNRVTVAAVAMAGLGLTMTACATPPAAPVVNDDACGTARFAHLIGTRAEGIDRATLPAGTRVLTPDAIVTRDFRADRLNIMVGADGIVGSLRCY